MIMIMSIIITLIINVIMMIIIVKNIMLNLITILAVFVLSIILRHIMDITTVLFVLCNGHEAPTVCECPLSLNVTGLRVWGSWEHRGVKILGARFL